MQGANSLEEAESRMPDFCPVCLRKLLYCTRSESADGVKARYERLHVFYRANRASFGGAHLRWVQRRLGLPPEASGLAGASERASEGQLCEPCDPQAEPHGSRADHGADAGAGSGDNS